MKKLLPMMMALSCLITTNAFAAHCFVVNTCVKRISSCKLQGKEPTYSSVTATIYRRYQFSYEWNQEIECLQRNGTVTRMFEAGTEVVHGLDSIDVKEIRIPATINEVPAHYHNSVNEAANESCAEERETLTNSIKNCR